MITSTVADAYATCESITREQARNFYYGIRLLPSDKRAALCAVYALARRIDDIGDGEWSTADKLAGLAVVRQSLADLRTDSADPVVEAVADCAERFPIPLDAFDELIDGVEMDVLGHSYTSFDELVGYCRCVAGGVGRLCLGVFGGDVDARASAYANSLGIALQQTNILRDIREDLTNARVYLPREDLDRFGVELTLDADGQLVDPDGGLAALIRDSARRATEWYTEGLRLIPLLDRRSAACCLAMSGIYRRLLAEIAAEPTTVYDRRLSLSGWQKARVAARSLAGLT